MPWRRRRCKNRRPGFPDSAYDRLRGVLHRAETGPLFDSLEQNPTAKANVRLWLASWIIPQLREVVEWAESKRDAVGIGEDLDARR